MKIKLGKYLCLMIALNCTIHFFCINLCAEPKKPNILFIHHSVGHALIRDGKLRQIFSEAGFAFWDHGYNDPYSGLSDEKGGRAGCYWIPDNDTTPFGLAKLLNMNPKKDNAIKKILQNHDMIMMKSCFPANKIMKDDHIKDVSNPHRRSIYNYKRHYQSIAEVARRYPDKMFIIITTPPLHPEVTTREEAIRAKQIADWLISNEYLGNHRNLLVFDLFSVLADEKTYMLQASFQPDEEGGNSHPNPVANMMAAPLLADFVINKYLFGKNIDTPKIKLSYPFSSPVVRVSKPLVTIEGSIESEQSIKEFAWSNLYDRRIGLKAGKMFRIEDIRVERGVNSILFTAIDNRGLRSSKMIALQYYSDDLKASTVFDEKLQHGSLSNMDVQYAEANESFNALVINGTGKLQRAAINDIKLDIRDFDPRNTYLEIFYDQGTDKSIPRLFMPGIGNTYLKPDSEHGLELIKIPFSQYVYVSNTMNRIVFRGEWKRESKVYIRSIKLKSKLSNKTKNRAYLQK
jgi:hypothetical protein